jgi:hypothetical protein
VQQWTREVVTDQPATRACSPPLITLYAGGNDVLDPGNRDPIHPRRLRETCIALTNTGATLPLFTGYDVPLVSEGVWLFWRDGPDANEGAPDRAENTERRWSTTGMPESRVRGTRDRVKLPFTVKIRRNPLGDRMKPRWPLPVEVPGRADCGGSRGRECR